MIIDAGVLISVDRNEDAARVLAATILNRNLVVRTTEPVVAQVARSGQQVRLHRFLNSAVARIHALDDGRAVGRLLAASETNDVVDAHVALLAHQLDIPVVTGDPGDLRHLRDSNSLAFDVIAWP